MHNSLIGASEKMSGGGVDRTSRDNSSFTIKRNGTIVGRLVFCRTFIMEGKVVRKLSGRQNIYNYGPWVLNPVRGKLRT